MKREQFINYLLNPDELKGESAVALNSLIKEFPYFQSAQLLYLKTLHNENSIHYQSQLKIAAAYSANRKSLYFLINGEPKKRDSKVESPSIMAPVLNENEVLQTLEVQASPKELAAEPQQIQASVDTKVSVEEIQQPAMSAPILVTVAPVEEEIVEIQREESGQRIDEISNTVSPALIEGEAIQEKEIPVTTASHKDKHLDSLNAGIIAEAINSGISSEIEDLAPIVQEPKKEEKEPEVVVAPAPEIEKPEIKTHEFHSFVEWLKISQGKDLGQKSATAQTEKIENKPEEAPKLEEKRALIEKFITTEPRIVPKKQEFYNPVNKARQSVMENDFIVSETLAKVYLKQGNFQRALKSYEILSLKFPEKSTYFAAQILKIKEIQQEKNKS